MVGRRPTSPGPGSSRAHIPLLLLLILHLSCAPAATRRIEPPGRGADAPSESAGRRASSEEGPGDLPDLVVLDPIPPCDSPAPYIGLDFEKVPALSFLELLTVYSGGLTVQPEIGLLEEFLEMKVSVRVDAVQWDCIVTALADGLGLEIEVDGTDVTLKRP